MEKFSHHVFYFLKSYDFLNDSSHRSLYFFLKSVMISWMTVPIFCYIYCDLPIIIVAGQIFP